MSTINETFDKLRVQILEGSTSVLELANEYGLENGFICYFMILNPDHNNFDDNLSKLEMDYNMISAGYCDTKAGFIEDLGEVGRLGFFQEHISEDKIREVLQDVLFGIIKVN
jgi:hypothetical protein